MSKTSGNNSKGQSSTSAPAKGSQGNTRQGPRTSGMQGTRNGGNWPATTGNKSGGNRGNAPVSK
jgi:hypothetical protein